MTTIDRRAVGGRAGRPPHVCIAPAERCAELLSRYAKAGCERVHLWPLGDEPRQIELAATAVLLAVEA